MSSGKDTRHFHAGKQRKTFDGVEFVEVLESHGRVFVSRDGRVVTPRRTSPYIPTRSGRFPYSEVRVDGYPASVHRIVYELFVEQIPEGVEIDHINTVCNDNRVENLRAVTSRENSNNPLTRRRALDAVAKSIFKAIEANRIPVIGIRHNTARAKTTVIGPFRSSREAAEATGISYKNISNVLRGKSKTAGGYKWEVYNV